MASMVAMASTAPAAPSKCPVKDLVEDTGTSLPRTATIAPLSPFSLAGVEVPWALT